MKTSPLKTLYLDDEKLQWFQKQDPPLQRSILNFNAFPWHQAHPSWLPQDIPKAFRRRLGHPQVSRLIQQAFEKEQLSNLESYLDFEKTANRWALLPRNKLQALSMKVGIVLQKDFFLKMISKKQREEAKEQLGNTLFAFATDIAPRLPLSHQDLKVSGIGLSANHNLTLRMLKTAQIIFQQLYASHPEGFLKRLQLKFPKTLKWEYEAPAEDSVNVYLHELLLKISKKSRTIKTKHPSPWNKSYI